jgi:hypothetical protein
MIAPHAQANAEDMDYFVFSAKQGQRVPVSVVIPQMKGQAGFAPMLAVVGLGLPLITGTLPAAIPISKTHGATVFVPPAKAGTFYEPFGGEHYWTRQDAVFKAPQAGNFMVLVWDAKGCWC